MRLRADSCPERFPNQLAALLYALIDTPHLGLTDDIPTAVPATGKFGVTTDHEKGQPLLGVLFANKLRTAAGGRLFDLCHLGEWCHPLFTSSPSLAREECLRSFRSCR